MKTSVCMLYCAAALPVQAMCCELDELVFLQDDANAQYAFVQRKTVAVLPNPLISQGVLSLSVERELIWQTRQPLKSTLVISEDGIRQFNRYDMPISDAGNQMADELAQVFLNLLSGNTALLTANFSPSLSCENEEWKLQLQPLAAPLDQLLNKIVIEGSDGLDSITFSEVRGDHTEILINALKEEAPIDTGLYLGN